MYKCIFSFCFCCLFLLNAYGLLLKEQLYANAPQTTCRISTLLFTFSFMYTEGETWLGKCR